jgi:predicted CXXCH cytochrome family protein
VRNRTCTACHSPHAAKHGKLLAQEVKDACLSCHAKVVPAAAKSRHAPIEKTGCSGCHDPHASKVPGVLLGAGAELCASCHKDIVARATGAKVKHGPAAKGACTDCHDPHGSAVGPSLLRKAEPAVCVGCHKPDAPNFTKAHLRYPVGGAGCTTCHDPHGSSKPGMLYESAHQPIEKGMCNQCHESAADKTFKVRVSGAALCKRCHATELAKMSDKATRHRPVADGDCLACHAPHASRWKGLLAAKPVELCGRCHQDTIRRQERSLAKHQPMLDGDCVACHEPHASDNALLMARASNIETCGACHDWKGHTTHPLGSELADPRNPNLSVDCLVCHRAHGTPHKRLFPYATLTEMCTKCHRNYTR